MRQIVQAIWWWVRVTILVVVGIYALLSLWKNSGQTVRVWYWFDHQDDTSVVAVAVASFLAGGVICTTALALATATFRYRRTRAYRRQRAIEEQREAMAQKAAKLRTKPPPTPIVKRPPPPVTATTAVTPAVVAPVVTPAENDAIVVELRPPVKIDRAPAREVERVKESPAESPVVSEAIQVEAHRATPFASTPAIDPRAKPAASPEIVEEAKE